MRNEYWKSEPESETTLRFRAFSRKVNAFAALVAMIVLFATVAAAVNFGVVAKNGWNVLGFLALLAALPAAAYAGILRLAGSAFMRRILNERD